MNHEHAQGRETGAALIIGLVLLLVMTLLGITSMQSTTVQERMAGNLRQQDLAFQASEAALREGQRLVIDRPDLFENPNENPGIYVRRMLEGEQLAGRLMPDADDDASWDSDVLSLGESAAGFDSLPALSDWSAHFRIEKQPAFDVRPGSIGEPVPGERQAGLANYRIQSRSRGGAGLSEVILETEIRR